MLSVSALLHAASINGRITAEGSTPIADTTVVLLELDLITLTDSAGRFSFEDLEETEYSLLVIAPGFDELEVPVTVPFKPVEISMSPEVIEMETIVIQAEQSEPEDLINDGVTSEELERLPVRADPFEALALEDGIIKPLDIITAGADTAQIRESAENGSDALVLPAVRLSGNRRSQVSVYGGESDWNNYYYNRIRMPTNRHTFGFPDADSIIPVEAADSIAVYKGAYPVEYGPGIGGLFTINPKEDIEGVRISFTPSIMDISAISTVKFTDDLSMLISANQSVLNFTVLPVISKLLEAESEDDLNEDETPTSISYGDALLSLLFTPPNHNLSIDLLAYYDEWAFDLSFEDSYLKSVYGPYFLAGSAEWIYSVSPLFSNTVYAFGSIYRDKGDFDFYLHSAETGSVSDYESHWSSDVNSIQAGDDVFLSITDQLAVAGGVNGRLSFLSGRYKDDNLVDNGEGLILSDYDHSLGVDEMLLSVYGWAKILGSINNFEYKLGSGLLWYPEAGSFRPAVEGEGILSFERISIALAAGWSPGVIDEFSYINRRLDELYYDIATATSPYQPPMAFSTAAQSVFLFGESSSLKISPYFSWYYNLSGISMSVSYTDLDQKFVSLDPEEGYSTGVDIGWSTAVGKNFDWDISYAFSMTRYNTESLGWISPNTEVQHAIKSGGLFTAGGFSAGLNLFIYCGSPFTPAVVEDSPAGPVQTLGEYNSAFDYMPSYEFTTNLKYEWTFEKFSMSIFWNSSNLIDGLNVSMNGFKPMPGIRSVQRPLISHQESIFSHTG